MSTFRRDKFLSYRCQSMTVCTNLTLWENTGECTSNLCAILRQSKQQLLSRLKHTYITRRCSDKTEFLFSVKVYNNIRAKEHQKESDDLMPDPESDLNGMTLFHFSFNVVKSWILKLISHNRHKPFSPTPFLKPPQIQPMTELGLIKQPSAYWIRKFCLNLSPDLSHLTSYSMNRVNECK